MNDPAEYLEAVELALVESPIVNDFHPELPNFPHHCHVGSETNVVPSEPTSLLKALNLIQRAFESETKNE